MCGYKNNRFCLSLFHIDDVIKEHRNYFVLHIMEINHYQERVTNPNQIQGSAYTQNSKTCIPIGNTPLDHHDFCTYGGTPCVFTDLLHNCFIQLWSHLTGVNAVPGNVVTSFNFPPFHCTDLLNCSFIHTAFYGKTTVP